MKKFEPHTFLYCIAGRMFTGPETDLGVYGDRLKSRLMLSCDFIVATDGCTFKTLKNRCEGKQLTAFSFNAIRDYIEAYYRGGRSGYRLNPFMTNVMDEREIIEAKQYVLTTGHGIQYSYAVARLVERIHREIDDTCTLNEIETLTL